jgi:putative cardiolipin synthase
MSTAVRLARRGRKRAGGADAPLILRLESIMKVLKLQAVMQLASHCCDPLSLWQALASIAVRVALIALVMAMVGCASLPSGVQRPASRAVTDVAATELARIVAANTPDDKRELSGFRLLPAGDQAFDARIALARRAEKTLDVQYYLIAHDASGLQFLRELRDAAARSVRVRILVDDLYAIGQDELLAALAAHAHVEVRMFNPLPVRRGGLVSRVVFSMHQFLRINGRMHNKLFIADNVLSVTGGRDVANQYFGRSEPANFIDMDILSSGPVVRELSNVFDRYWNSEHAYPVQSLAPVIDAEAARRFFEERVQTVAKDHAVAARDPLGRTSLEAQLASCRLDQHFASVQVHADAPAKINGVNAVNLDGTVMSGKLDLVRAAKSEVLLVSPYFIPGSTGLAAMREAITHSVRLTVMTNSIATTDEPLVHFGYARYRRAMLKMGVTLYELMPPDGRKSDALGELHASLGRLHAKLAVVDNRFLFIGSMNMDGRSARWNTEVGLVIDSPELADEVASLLRRDRLPSSYKLRIAGSHRRIQWVAGKDANEVVHSDEPHASWGQRLRLSLVSMFVDEDLL